VHGHKWLWHIARHDRKYDFKKAQLRPINFSHQSTYKNLKHSCNNLFLFNLRKERWYLIKNKRDRKQARRVSDCGWGLIHHLQSPFSWPNIYLFLFCFPLILPRHVTKIPPLSNLERVTFHTLDFTCKTHSRSLDKRPVTWQ
jgi:hypothetical protein